ncbi:MAG: His/Gly/Thr/Pro-type tRNA ligase C-terminal domain-containing protein [Candidatus Shikimatogenerans bostrichidophilus]|nr:MAG: His/Gly/Thr/Pro-type tRNA ligase C-terminal domain-containing protein [Candidatus Shikimatogenerans bostrichidophilus]
MKKNKKNHKKIGEKLKMFFFSKNIGAGLPLWLPNGIYFYKKIKKIIKKINIKNKYKEIYTPNIAKDILYKKSGHLKKYYNYIFKLKKKKLYLKPMNCPFHCEIYKFYKNISYKKLPIKFFEFGTVYRNEKSGVLNGLFRTISFTQDDGHIFCRRKKKYIYKEIYKIIKIIKKLYNLFKIKKFYIRFSFKKKEKKYINNKKYWIISEKILLYIKKKIKKKYNTYIKYNEAAFYGPKIDFIIKDNYKRKWQLGTIQIDFNTPIRFNLKYFDKNNNIKNPVIIHRAYLGSIERFIAIFLENNKGKIPFELLKIQVIIIPISKNNLKYSILIKKKLIFNKIKVKINKNFKENLNKKIKKYENIKIPFLLIIGNKEEKEKKIFIRKNGIGKIGIFTIKKTINYIFKNKK